jgi:hypothetical protein
MPSQLNNFWRYGAIASAVFFVTAAFGQVTINGHQHEAEMPAVYESTPVEADVAIGAEPLSDQVEDLKQAVLNLNRDLLILEEELLFPANTQIALFLSMDVGQYFQVDAVEVKIDNKLVASHLYTPQQAQALFRGGVQRLYVGNLRNGSHEVTAFFVGKGPEGRDYKRGATINIDKQLDPKMLELRIVDSTTKLQPVFDIKEWQL